MSESYIDSRNAMVRKANILIQKNRFSLSLQQQKIILYLISAITPFDEDFHTYEFAIQQFCKTCGIDFTSGKNYSDLKAAIKELRDRSMWITLPDGRETTVAWIEKAYIDRRSGTISLRLDADLKPFLLQLKTNFTQYELIYTLHFKSKYTIRMYELVKSIHYDEQTEYIRAYNLDELRRLLGAEAYKEYKAFKRRVLTPAIKEVNEYSDKNIHFAEEKRGQTVVRIVFSISTKDPFDRMRIRVEIEKDFDTVDGQQTIWSDENE